MEVKHVIKIITVIVSIFLFNNVFAQNKSAKYLLFNSLKDSIIIKNNIKYYMIDENLFDINRYNEIDTINLKEFKEINFSSVTKIWKEGKNLFIPVSERKNLFIETKNEIFENIFVLEKISNYKYKRTRVWWKDY